MFMQNLARSIRKGTRTFEVEVLEDRCVLSGLIYAMAPLPLTDGANPSASLSVVNADVPRGQLIASMVHQSIANYHSLGATDHLAALSQNLANTIDTAEIPLPSVSIAVPHASPIRVPEVALGAPGLTHILPKTVNVAESAVKTTIGTAESLQSVEVEVPGATLGANLSHGVQVQIKITASSVISAGLGVGGVLNGSVEVNSDGGQIALQIGTPSAKSPSAGNNLGGLDVVQPTALPQFDRLALVSLPAGTLPGFAGPLAEADGPRHGIGLADTQVAALREERPEAAGAGAAEDEGLGAPQSQQAADMRDSLTPEFAGLLSDANPFDLAAFDQALQQFLDQLGDLRQNLTGWMGMFGPGPWICLGLAVVAAAYVGVRQRAQRLATTSKETDDTTKDHLVFWEPREDA